MPKAQGITGEQWQTCDRCGFLHPLSKLSKQKGLTLCTCHRCLDNLDVERRDQVIAEVLSNGDEFTDTRHIVQEDPGETLSFF